MAVELTDDQPSPWVRLQLKDTDLEPGDDTQIPIQLVARRFKSSSEASYEFIHDPLAYLIEAQRTDGILDEVALDTSWKVTTHIINHHQTLKARHLYALVTANGSESTVGIQLSKLQAED